MLFLVAAAKEPAMPKFGLHTAETTPEASNLTFSEIAEG